MIFSSANDKVILSTGASAMRIQLYHSLQQWTWKITIWYLDYNGSNLTWICLFCADASTATAHRHKALMCEHSNRFKLACKPEWKRKKLKCRAAVIAIHDFEEIKPTVKIKASKRTNKQIFNEGSRANSSTGSHVCRIKQHSFFVSSELHTQEISIQ